MGPWAHLGRGGCGSGRWAPSPHLAQGPGSVATAACRARVPSLGRPWALAGLGLGQAWARPSLDSAKPRFRAGRAWAGPSGAGQAQIPGGLGPAPEGPGAQACVIACACVCVWLRTYACVRVCLCVCVCVCARACALMRKCSFPALAEEASLKTFFQALGRMLSK